MSITFTQLLIWIIIAAVVGFIAEIIAGRRAPDGIIGSIVLGFLSIILIEGVFHFRIEDDPQIAGVPIVSTLLAAILLVVIWTSFTYRRTVRRV